MKAWVLNEINALPVLKDVALPEPQNGHAILKIYASSLNHRDVWITKGKYAGIKLPCILGSDGCGMLDGKRMIVNPGWNWGSNEAVQSKNFTVLGMPHDGTFAEYVSVPTLYLYEAPEYLTDEEAAALPLAGVTAYRALITKCAPAPESKVLITGAGGGVALMCVQFALALGCEVYITTGSDEKMDKVMKMGIKGAVNYRNEDWAVQLKSMAGGFDVIIDSAGGDGFRHLISLANPGCKISFYGGSLGVMNGINPQTIFWKQISIMGSTMGSDKDFAEMLAFVSAHKIKPIIDEVFSIMDWQKAFLKMEEGRQFGKLVCIHK